MERFLDIEKLKQQASELAANLDEDGEFSLRIEGVPVCEHPLSRSTVLALHFGLRTGHALACNYYVSDQIIRAVYVLNELGIPAVTMHEGLCRNAPPRDKRR